MRVCSSVRVYWAAVPLSSSGPHDAAVCSVPVLATVYGSQYQRLCCRPLVPDNGRAWLLSDAWDIVSARLQALRAILIGRPDTAAPGVDRDRARHLRVPTMPTLRCRPEERMHLLDHAALSVAFVTASR